MPLTIAKASGHLEVTTPLASLGSTPAGTCSRVVVRDTVSGDEIGTYTDPSDGSVSVVLDGPPEGGSFTIGLEVAPPPSAGCR